MSDKSKHINYSLIELEQRDDFARRHIGPGNVQLTEMLTTLKLNSLDELILKAVPGSILMDEPLSLPPAKSESEAVAHLQKLGTANKQFISMIGMGYYPTIMPAVIQRNVLENPGWYTAYTPYQAEVSQGRLQALLNYQQMVMDLTGMALANASLLDEATAAAEAMSMCRRVSKSKSNNFYLSDDCHPQTIAVVKTRARHLGFKVIVGDPFKDLESHLVFGALFTYPGSSGEVRDLRSSIGFLHQQRALAVVSSDLLSLALLTPPGELGADVVVGNAQRFGVPMGYGGPHAAFYATRDEYKRSVPGRIIGVSVDARGRPALRMALQTREQHIRRDKATSNICTAQVLLAVLAGLYAVYHGASGIKTIAQRVHRLTQILATGLHKLGIEIVNKSYFDTLTLQVPGKAEHFAEQARAQRINLRLGDKDHLGISLDETSNRQHIQTLWRIFSEQDTEFSLAELDAESQPVIPQALQRSSEFLNHPVFQRYHSETEMLRYLRRLAAKDIALDRSMIALGSCTMKLNASAEMQAITWPEYAELHPFIPIDQAQGYQSLFGELETMLCAVTGFDAISLQPNAGSQGEYAGLLTIKRFHESRQQGHRNICLIPESAHGTNPASARMAGLNIIAVKCDDAGNVDVNDLRAKAQQNTDKLAALMITYPSTHGVFEAAIKEICAIVHEYGGQVYLDGANLNALLGVCRLAELGADVAHINLHKTFAIPHGGGGPGMGPIGVVQHLSPFLPDHPVVDKVNPAKGDADTIGTVSSAPWGSSSILPISWAYIAMMGGPGLTRATQVAILNANYIAQRLAPHFPILYTGENGMVAHECIIDLRQIKETTDISVDDIAKRLVDYGYHAPTISFPVADTIMIEPTESESKLEIDRFCDSMINIGKELAAVENGSAEKDNNLLRNAPHTYDLLIEQEWSFPYTKEQAFFPLPHLHQDKYWPPVARIDNVYGDRHLECGYANDKTL